MENQFEQYLLDNEKILWKKVIVKRKKLKEFFILTDKRWIQKAKLYEGDLAILRAILLVKNEVIFIDLDDIKVIASSLGKKGYDIEFFLNWEENAEYTITFLYVNLTHEEYPKFMHLLKQQIQFGEEEPYKGSSYTTIYYRAGISF